MAAVVDFRFEFAVEEGVTVEQTERLYEQMVELGVETKALNFSMMTGWSSSGRAVGTEIAFGARSARGVKPRVDTVDLLG